MGEGLKKNVKNIPYNILSVNLPRTPLNNNTYLSLTLHFIRMTPNLLCKMTLSYFKTQL